MSCRPLAGALLALLLAGCIEGRVSMPFSYVALPLWLVCGVIGAWIATTKGRGGCSWFALCALLGPLGVIIAAVVSRKS